MLSKSFSSLAVSFFFKDEKNFPIGYKKKNEVSVKIFQILAKQERAKALKKVFLIYVKQSIIFSSTFKPYQRVFIGHTAPAITHLNKE